MPWANDARILFEEEGNRRQILLALDGFNKKTQKTPGQRLTWRSGAWRIGGSGEIRSALRATGVRCTVETR